MIYLQLFWAYFKVGLFAIGGGMATIPFLYDLSDKTGWFTHAQLADMLAVSESTPGAIGVNMATFVGYVTAGIPGAVVATVALALPSIIVILLIALFLSQFRHSRRWKRRFTVCGLLRRLWWQLPGCRRSCWRCLIWIPFM